MDKRPKGVCVDCWARRLLFEQQCLEAGLEPGKMHIRPAPHPGPRCASDHRAKVKASKARQHENKVQQVYGLGPGEYAQLLAFQGGACAICLRARGKVKRLAVDHDHKTQDVRGLLCGVCNKWILGHGRDDVAFFQRVLAYLASPPYKQMKILKEFTS